MSSSWTPAEEVTINKHAVNEGMNACFILSGIIPLTDLWSPYEVNQL